MEMDFKIKRVQYLATKNKRFFGRSSRFRGSGSREKTDDQEMAFKIKRFQYLAKKNKRFSGRSNGFRGSDSREKKDDQKGYLNWKKPSHFIARCPELQKDKSKKGSFQKDNFKNKFKKSLMETWDELNNEDSTSCQTP